MSAPFIDTLSPAYDADIHGAHRTAREKSWYAQTPLGLLLLRYRDVQWLLRDARFREQGADALALAGITDGPLLDWFGQIVSNQEGSDHRRLRQLVSQAFTPRRVEKLRPLMRDTANEFLAAFVGRGRCEFVSAFAAPYPVRVIGALLGVPPGDFARFHAWSSDLSLAFGSQIAPERARIERALGNLEDYVDSLLALRRRSPADDLITALIAAGLDGDRLSPQELRAMITVLIFGGQDTTQCQLACAVATFLDHAGQWDRLAAQPRLARRAVEEVLRYEPAGSGSPRLALEDVDYRGLRIAAGTVVVPSAPAANRDPEAYDDPELFEIARDPDPPMLTFGSGAHYCLGAALARAELEEALPLLARRLARIELDGDARWRSGTQIRGPERLPIRFRARD
ncbi:MAG: cytochrome P450 [Myxococcota bacterium]|nr:cytochrome P450 [Myxococcota bacterium]